MSAPREWLSVRAGLAGLLIRQFEKAVHEESVSYVCSGGFSCVHVMGGVEAPHCTCPQRARFCVAS